MGNCRTRKSKRSLQEPKHPYTIGLLAKPPINIDLKSCQQENTLEIDEEGFSGDVVKNIDDVLKNN